MKKFELELVSWCDAIGDSGNWLTLDEALEWAASDHWVVTQVGWVIDETDEYILMCSKINEGNDVREAQYGSFMKIPTTWIRSRTKLNL